MHLGLLCSESIRPKMAGIGIRYYDLSRYLRDLGFQITLAHPGESCKTLDLKGITQVRIGSSLERDFADCEAVIVQGGLADVLLSKDSFTKPVIVDLYDPWLVENFVYLETLGLEPFRRDLSSWRVQLGRGDFFLCSCEAQRTFYLGFLTALGRVHPEKYALDPDLRGLIDCVSFGLPETVPEYQPLLNLEQESFHIYFGTIYDWYDPLTLVDALVPLTHKDWVLHFVNTPNPSTTPQTLLKRVRTRCEELDWWDTRVKLHDWFPIERRFDLLREMDVLVSPHKPDLESRLSLRTRYLDALLVECPVIATRGGALTDLLLENDAGWIVEPGDSSSLTIALERVLAGENLTQKTQAGRLLASNFRWENIGAPLIRFLENPQRDESQDWTPSNPLKRKLVGLWKNLV